ncbi:hypothetical protein M436DRAFT_62249 [Aureobasidium namibiae CBS 147.97]|uniref:Xylanolytic transcriptional activator regulatory domain-containing protein n=1 Tax=Aureobasidium namibiae CBS 147.97 TaxID=1043004 RepID=A0A074WYG3_9PEZI|nr:uncharacterized protein M436DRAFT_62249 [Aureobasidium namibiae CBS 147.97]KEQ74807.1 hypothetical protein M436DRAFT_62249 [Aureobasidium namibiae CBS 147.97]
MYGSNVLLIENRSSSVATVTSDNPVLAQVLERLKRLEDIVLTKSDSVTGNITFGDDDSRSIPNLHEDVVQNEIFHSIGRSDVSPQANIDRQEDEVRETEITATKRSDTRDEEASFTFVSAKVSELAFDVNLRTPVLTKISVDGGRVIRRICLPERKEAHILFQSFAKSLGSWYHIYHRQTVETLLDKTYYQIACGQVPSLSHIALLLSIFASGAYFQTSAAWPECVFSDPQTANQISLCWKQNTLDILDFIQRATTPTVCIELRFIAFIILNLEGLSKKYWVLHTTSITLARDLSLHVLDHPARPKPKDVIENEVKRRIWSFLATTDWLLGSMPSPQEGTYNINARHCHINKPMNIDDDDLAANRIVDKPLSEPTEMSYSLIRTYAGDMCRNLADMVHPMASGVNNVDYNEIIALEQKTAGMAVELPFYFRLDEDSRRRTEPYLNKYPQLATQRYLLQQGFHCHRSRIHRPFLIRGSLDARFQFSRDACLESVRKSLEIRRMLNREKRGAVLPVARLNFVVYHIFMGALTLALDLCFNKSTNEAEDQSRRAELKEACLMLHEAKTEMPAADRFLRPLMELLQKYKIQLQDSGPQNQYLTPAGSTPIAGPDMTVLAQNTANFSGRVSGQDFTVVPDAELDSLWEDFINMVPDTDAPGWDDLLADFDQASLFVGV